MKNILLFSVLLICQVGVAQQASELKTFKSKEAKTKQANLRDVKLNDDGSIELTAFLKKDKAERIVLNSDLTLQKVEEIAFDFDAKEKEKKAQIWKSFSPTGSTYVESEILKSDVLDVASTDFVSRAAGTNLIDKGKYGLKGGLGFSVQKGDIQLVTNVIGERVRRFTSFVPKAEVKLKSDEGKNMVYEFHTSSAENMQVEFNESDTYSKTSSAAVKSFADNTGDLLLIGNRKPIVKFGKAPSAEDLLPVYYAYKMSAETMDIVAQNKFAEPVSRGIIYREALKINKGILLVSAPTNLVKQLDPNPRNYVFRLVGDDTKLKFEIIHEVPSGQLWFSQAFELPDGSIVLLAAINEKRYDKYFNQGTYAVPSDAYYVMTIKDGKVTQRETIKADVFYSTFKTPGDEKPGKFVYNPAQAIENNITNEPLPNGGMLSVWAVSYPKPDNKAITVYAGDLAFQFSPEGKLEARYWIENKNSIKPPVEAAVVKKSDTEFYWLTFTTNEAGTLATPSFTKIDTNAKTISDKTMVSDGEHFVSHKFPYKPVSNGIQFFGFDEGGKEFWTQTVSFK